MAGRQLANKWLKTEALLSNADVAAHIPQTRLYGADSLRSMLHQFGMVVIKPLRGGGGYGVIKVTYAGGVYAYTYMSRRHGFGSFESMFRALNRVKVGRKYMIQQGIHLARIAGRPIDYRVKVVKENGAWVYRSMVGRLARPGLFVTNLCKGGTMLSAREGLSRSLSRRAAGRKRREMRSLTNTCVQILETRFPGIGQLGFDYGVDRGGKIWIFEVNTRPQ
ncbi:YheC/YheD family protein [Paenibacillus timonensis]|jgi:glutathione synthase/RimK-type ligase-like ATP-grasp enzyme|uniref:YheC/YheD family protein n=1 Tax=Paenibacillus timonensis TaxID=225915 RepID=A0ABW3SEI3_9BACL|nr:YheC/YheD family protein [Paenibacillus timonensis]MCH1641820.1 YheC/YheD family protein [Paenibacillus timonensis]